MRARVTVTLKTGILDPQGKAIEGALASLGVAGVASVRQGKLFDIEIDAADRTAAEAALRAACEKLLANTVIENFHVELEHVPESAAEPVGPADEDAFAPDMPVDDVVPDLAVADSSAGDAAVQNRKVRR